MRKFITSILCMSFIAYMIGIGAAAYDGSNRLLVEAAYSSEIIVDGIKDDGYGKMYAVEQQGIAHTEGLELTTGNVAVAWNESEIYFYIEVYDQGTPYAVSTTDWKTDGPEYFLDLMNNKSTSYDKHCFRVRVIVAKDSPDSIWDNWLSFNGTGTENPVSSASPEDFKLSVCSINGKDWSDGYAVELSYKYSNYIAPITNGYLMGWDVQICDDVLGLGNRDSQAFLGNPADVAHNNPSGFGSEIKFIGAPNDVAAPDTTQTEPSADEPSADDTPAISTDDDTEVPVIAPKTFDSSVAFIGLVLLLSFACFVGIKKSVISK